MKIVKKVFEFEWDQGNIGKNLKHGVKDQEAEEAFEDENKVVYNDKIHSEKEDRFVLIGKIKQGRLLYIIFTKRRGLFSSDFIFM